MALNPLNSSNLQQLVLKGLTTVSLSQTLVDPGSTLDNCLEHSLVFVIETSLLQEHVCATVDLLLCGIQTSD